MVMFVLFGFVVLVVFCVILVCVVSFRLCAFVMYCFYFVVIELIFVFDSVGVWCCGVCCAWLVVCMRVLMLVLFDVY